MKSDLLKLAKMGKQLGVLNKKEVALCRAANALWQKLNRKAGAGLATGLAEFVGRDGDDLGNFWFGVEQALTQMSAPELGGTVWKRFVAQSEKLAKSFPSKLAAAQKAEAAAKTARKANEKKRAQELAAAKRVDAARLAKLAAVGAPSNGTPEVNRESFEGA